MCVIGNGGMGLFMLGIGLADCNHKAVVVLMTVGYGLYGFSRAGYMVVTLDFAPRYAGRLYSNTETSIWCSEK